ncbi:MAG TPA: hypothetical protein VJO34_14705 [Methylomirabilota bacterium]|nr:hypothetical protein [Methylomirabilota bacterium]
MVEDADSRLELVRQTGQLAVPVIRVGEEWIAGFDRRRLESLLKL